MPVDTFASQLSERAGGADSISSEVKENTPVPLGCTSLSTDQIKNLYAFLGPPSTPGSEDVLPKEKMPVDTFASQFGHASAPTPASNSVTSSSIEMLSASSKSASPCLDIEDGLVKCGGEEDLYFGLVKKFAMRLPTLIGEIKKAVAEKNLLILKREAHSLKGSSGYIAAKRLSDLAGTAQNRCIECISHLEEKNGETVTEGPQVGDEPLDPQLMEAIKALQGEFAVLTKFLTKHFEISIPLEPFDSDAD